jgi:AcrR family transcriptional regulator
MTAPAGRVARNTGGQARTRLARRAVVGAARTLFLERGYQPTTIEAISVRSDVPPATVYRLFASKLGILKALLDVSIAGDDQRTSVSERPEVSALLAENDSAKLLTAFAELVVAINIRTNEIYRVLSNAAASDTGAAALFADYQKQRAQGQRNIARQVTRATGLRPGLRERDVADLIHAFMSPELFRLLVTDRGWTPERYQKWLTQTIAHQLTTP